LHRAVALVEGLKDDALAGRLGTSFTLGQAAILAERLDAALKIIDRGIDVARAAGNGQNLMTLVYERASVLALLGRGADARDAADGAIEMARLLGPTAICWATGVACFVAVHAGDVNLALPAGEESVEIGRDLGLTQTLAIAGTALAVVRLEMGQPARCRTELLETGGGSDLPLLAASQRCWSYEALTMAELALGDRGSAEHWADRAEANVAPGRALSAGHARRARAALLLADGKPALAAELALAAAGDEAIAGGRVAEARSRIVAGRALAMADQRDDAIRELQRAEAALTMCGAVRFADEAARELRRLGRRVTRSGHGATGSFGLSARELEVARLVTAGRTNREIAAALFISQKTVESHLSNVFAKLGVTSRAAVAGVLARHQTDPP
jgi:DNA-binding CsgD family transcriptional regulator